MSTTRPALVVATAGHVDHGKSTLVRALTGQDPDRLAEEQRRGLTIELGFAWCDLPSGGVLSLVDVPGHERFVATMLSGLGPATAVLLVVAADQGWQAQSQEHLDAVVAAGVQDVVLAVTRSDLAPPDRVLADAHRRLAAVGLVDVEAVAVGASHVVATAAEGTVNTGETVDTGGTGGTDGATATGSADGHAALVAALDRVALRQPAPAPDADVRLWVDRSFTVRGRGRVVTGTLLEGTVAVGDLLDGSHGPVRVRGVQSLGADRPAVTGPARVALRVDGEVARGDVLTTPGCWQLTDVVDVALTRALPDRVEQAHVHVGTADLVARVRPLGDRHARLLLPRALPARWSDRLVLRDPGGRGVLAGAVVLDIEPPALHRRGAAAARAAELAGPAGQRELGRRGAVERSQLVRHGIAAPEGALEVDGWLVSKDRWQAWVRGLGELVAAVPALSQGPTAADAAGRLGAPPALLARLVDAAGVRQVDGRLSDGRPVDLGAAEAAVTELERRLETRPFDAPDRVELARLGLGPQHLVAAARAGRLVRLAPDLVLLPTAPGLAMARLRGLPPPWSVGDAARALGTSRRVAVPLLEHLDGARLTRRTPEGRQLTESSTFVVPAAGS